MARGSLPAGEMGHLVQDLKFAVRAFARAPAFTAIAVLTMALGIGANVAIFSVVDSLVLRPLPFPESARLMLVESINPRGQGSNFSWPDFDDVRKQNEVFSAVAGFHGDSLIVTQPGAAPLRLDASAVTANLFDVLQAPPALGRGFAAEEETDGKNHVIVLTNAAWHKYWNGDPGIIGRTLTVDDLPYTVVGVTGASFRFSPNETPVEAYVPVPRAFDTQLAGSRGAHYMFAIGRLKPGVTVAQANANLATIAAAQGKVYPDSNAGRSLVATELHQALTKDARPALLILLGVVAFVLLIACANVANLLLARASVRHRELAIRLALGAGRARIVRQMLTESLLLSVTGAALGALLAVFGLDALRGMIPVELSNLTEIAIDGRVLAFAALLAIMTGLAFGLWPALQASDQSPGDALKAAGTRATAGTARQRARSLLVAGEVAAATLLLVGAGLMLRSFARVSGVDPGFQPDHLMTTYVALPETRYKDNAQTVQFYRQLTEKVAAIPGVQSVAVGTPLPFTGVGITLRFTIAGEPPPPPDRPNVADMSVVNPSWFTALGVPLKEGRPFSTVDDQPSGPLVVIVSEAFARKYFPSRSAVGEHILIGWGDREKEPREIVGVVGDVHRESLESETNPAMYAPFSQGTFNYIGVAVRTSAGTGMAAALREAVTSIDRDQPLSGVDTMRDNMSRSLLQRRLSTTLLSLFGGVALALALIGVYGVMSYTVRQRVPEIGIRMALGARPTDVMRMMVRQGVVLAMAGVLVGLLAAYPLARLISSLLWGIGPADPVTYATISGLLVVVAALASYLPARRAARVDPMVALRAD